jgi:hypothetical protein
LEGRDRKIIVRGQPEQKLARIYVKNKPGTKTDMKTSGTE